MRKKTLYLLLLLALILPSAAVTAQDALVRFTYDADGNRTTRAIVLKKVEENGKNVETENSFLASANEQLGPVRISVYPNPTTGKVTIELHGTAASDINAMLTTVTGGVMEACRIIGSDYSFDLTGQPAGVYILRVVADNETRTWKIVKQ